MSSPAVQNQAATLSAPKCNPYAVVAQATPIPGPNELLIRVRAVAINPADSIVQEQGILYPPSMYPLVPGSDLAGDVVSAPAGSGFAAGDRVAACVERGAFQRFALAKPAASAKLPARVGYAQGCVLPLALCTAAAGLFMPGAMELRAPSVGQRASGNGGEVVLVWGAASAVGSCAVQMLVAAGYRVAATASAANAEYVRQLGAKWAFDYRKDGVEGEVVETLKAAAAAAAAGAPFAGVFSAIGDTPVLETCARIVDALGRDEKGRVVGSVLPPFMAFPGALPAGVKATGSNSAIGIPDAEMMEIFKIQPNSDALKLGASIWKWLESALETGAMKCKPDPVVVGSGVENIQKGVDAWRSGISAQKVVVELL